MKTKIVITLGPSTSDEGLIQQITSNNVSALRINTAHGDPNAWTDLIRKARRASKAPIIIDLVGHSIRYKGVDLGIKKGVSVTIKDADLNTHISAKLKRGQRLIINEGEINAIITSANNNEFTFKTKTDGVLTKNNKLTVPGLSIKTNVLNNNTRDAIRIVNEEKIEFVALSFTQDANDLKNLKKLVPDSLVIAKIEDETGVRKHEEIINESDAIIIGRGDLGAELKISHVPMIQKELIKACNKLAKPVIVATQILESMINTPYPTRAEASDIANAILDGADA
ncbi:MAG TPA: pyruvate kinase, partial [Candidatus Nanoarchaeia archaeon]|nr:pyruvate kinase [Candidatus Nanoarchaeia archaeon]